MIKYPVLYFLQCRAVSLFPVSLHHIAHYNSIVYEVDNSIVLVAFVEGLAGTNLPIVSYADIIVLEVMLRLATTI